jgi:hypothetical protein
MSEGKATPNKLNWNHVALWRGYLISWAIFVAWGVVLGWHLHPTVEEVATALFVLPALESLTKRFVCHVSQVFRRRDFLCHTRC